MRPVLFQVGPLPVSSFGVFLLLAFVVGILVTRARARRRGWDGGDVIDLSLYAIIGGIVGARVGHVLIYWKEFAGYPMRIFTIWRDAGLTFYGALLGGAVVAWAYGRRRGWSLGQIADVAAPGIALGYAIAMIGTLLYGLNYGRPTTLPWAVVLFGEPRHPTQLYLMAAALIIFAILLLAERRPMAPGRLFWLFILLYAIARIAIERYMDSPRVFGPLTLAQAANIVAGALALVMWIVLGRQPAPKPATTAVDPESSSIAPPAEPIATPASKTGEPNG